MQYRVTVQNLKSGGVSSFKFSLLSKAETFLTELEDNVYDSSNKHLRSEAASPPAILKQCIIFTSSEDLGRVTLEAIAK